MHANERVTRVKAQMNQKATERKTRVQAMVNRKTVGVSSMV